MKNEEDKLIEQEANDDFTEPADDVFDEEPRVPRFVALKVIGIIVGFIVLIAVAAFVITNLPQVKYKLSEHYASQGLYIEARDKLHDIRDYKDSERKYDEYGLIICKHYFAAGATDEAMKWAEWTSGSRFEDISGEAQAIIAGINEQKATVKSGEGIVQPAN